MDFAELGTILREERERRGLSIEVVMDATKISKTNILAMENGDRSGLPHPVYAKGFVKSYARYLGLDADELCMVVDQEYQNHPQTVRKHGYEVAPLAEKAFQEHESGEKRKRRSGLPLLILVVVLLAAAAAAFLILQGRERAANMPPAPATEQTAPSAAPAPTPDAGAAKPSEEGPGAAVTPDKPTSEAAPAIAPEPVAEAASAPAAPTKAAASPPVPPPAAAVMKPAPKPVAPKDKSAEVATVGRKGENSVSPAEEEQEKQQYDHILVIRATTEKGCWVGLWKGDETRMARDFVLKEGEPLRLMFNSPRRIRIGNAAGVAVTYNGKPYPLDPGKGNIQTLTFGSD